MVAALMRWLPAEASRHPDLMRLGYFGSYARGDWGVGSDVDLVAVVETDEAPFERRSAGWRLEGLPVPAEILVYTRQEWEEMTTAGTRFAEMLAREAVWVWPPVGKAGGKGTRARPARAEKRGRSPHERRGL